MGHYDESRDLSRHFSSRDYQQGVIDGRAAAQNDHYTVMMAIRDGLQKKADIVINANGDVTIHHVSNYTFKRDAVPPATADEEPYLPADQVGQKLSITLPAGLRPVGAVNEVRQPVPAMRPALDEEEIEDEEGALGSGPVASSTVG